MMIIEGGMITKLWCRKLVFRFYFYFVHFCFWSRKQYKHYTKLICRQQRPESKWPFSLAQWSWSSTGRYFCSLPSRLIIYRPLLLFASFPPDHLRPLANKIRSTSVRFLPASPADNYLYNFLQFASCANIFGPSSCLTAVHSCYSSYVSMKLSK